MGVRWTEAEEHRRAQLKRTSRTNVEVARVLNSEFHHNMAVRSPASAKERHKPSRRGRHAPEAEIRVMRQLLDKGLTASQVARAMSKSENRAFTRDMILGRAYRRGIMMPCKVGSGKPKYETKAPQNRPATCQESASQRVEEKLGTLVASEANTSKTGLNTGCRFPVGDPKEPDFRFCEKPRGDRESYCEIHHELTHQKSLYG